MLRLIGQRLQSAARVGMAVRARAAAAHSHGLAAQAAAGALAARAVAGAGAGVRAYHVSAALRIKIKASSFKRKKKVKKTRAPKPVEAPDAATLMAAEAAEITAARLAVDPVTAEAAASAQRAATTIPPPQREVEVGERLPEPEPFKPHKFRGIDERTVEHRIHSAVANRPYWGPRGTWAQMVFEAESASKAAMEARGQVYTPPLRNWKAVSAARAAKTAADKAAKEAAEAAIVPKDQNKIKAFLSPLGLNEFVDKFHSLEHLLGIRTLELRKLGLDCQQRKLLLKHTELVRQRQLRGLQLYVGSTLPDPVAQPKAGAKA